MSTAHIQSVIAALFIVSLAVVFLVLIFAGPGDETLIAQANADQYPRRMHDGRTVWACCESSIGPACAHVQDRSSVV